MPSYTAEVIWSRDGQNFLDKRYSRKHVLRFDGGAEVPGSPSPHHVPPPLSVPDAVDPEEAFVAALSSCHMLWFLSIAAKQGFVVDRYHDREAGIMGKNAEGRMMMSVVTLRHEAIFSGDKRPSAAQLAQLHHEAHEACYIANSVKTEVRCEPVAGAV